MKHINKTNKTIKTITNKNRYTTNTNTYQAITIHSEKNSA